MAKILTLNDFPLYLQAALQAIADVFDNGDVDAVLDEINADRENNEALMEEGRRRGPENHGAQLDLKFRQDHQ